MRLIKLWRYQSVIEQDVTCIICPIGCKILVKKDDSSCQIINGFKCKKGIEYAKNEALDPHRMLTSSIIVINGKWPLVSVKSSKPVPKNKIIKVINQIKKANVHAPVTSGQTLIKNVLNLGIDIIATKSIEKQ